MSVFSLLVESYYQGTFKGFITYWLLSLIGQEKTEHMASKLEPAKNAAAAPKTPANTPNYIKFLIGGVAGYVEN